jgi:hypothetical protein
LPVLRGRPDLELAKYPAAVFDFEEMKKKNFERLKLRVLEKMKDPKAS